MALKTPLTTVTPIAERSDATPSLWNTRFTQIDGNFETLSDLVAVYNVKNHGAVGDGSTDDTAALQALFDRLEDGGRVFFPNGQYKHDGTLATPAANDITIEFAPDAWLAPSAGWGLKIDNGGRHRLINPRIRINTGSTATRGIWVFSATWVKIYDPVIWSFINIPAGFDGIDVDDNAYWCEVLYPTIRKDSGSLTGTFAAGVRFQNVSNAGKVWGGSINHCDDGVHIEGINGCHVIGTAFEDCTDGVEVSQGASGPNGHIVALCRFESTTNDLNVSATSSPGTWPVQFLNTVFSTNNLVLNPNNLSIYEISQNGIRVIGNDKALELRNGGIGLRDSSGNATLDANGSVTLNADKDANGTGEISIRVQNGAKAKATADGFHIGTTNGTALTQIRVYTQSLTPASVSAAAVEEQTFAVTGLSTSDTVYVTPPSIANSTGLAGVRASATDTLAIRFVNPTAGALTPSSGTYRIVAVRS